MPAIIANQDYVIARNTSAIYRMITLHGPISRTELARACSLAAGSVTRITRQLLDHRLISEQELQTRERGRPAVSLVTEPDQIHIISAHAGRRQLHLGLWNMAGTLLASTTSQLNCHSQEQFSSTLISALQAFAQQHAEHRPKLAGIGLTLPAMVNTQEGIVQHMPHLPVSDFPLRQLVSDALGLPCRINNYTAAMALAELQMGKTQNCLNSLYVSVRNGVASGLIINGQLYEGCNTSAGEMGHIQIDPQGPTCACGNTGCLETLVSNPAIKRQYSSATNHQQPVTVPDICTRARQGETAAITVLEQSAAHLGRAIAMSVNMLRPEKIVLAGEIFSAGDVVLPVIQHCLKTQSVVLPGTKPIVLEVSELEQCPGYSGYALMRRALLEEGLILQVINNKTG